MMKFTEEHLWLREQEDEDGLITVGITEHAVAQLGDVIFVDLPGEGTTVAKDDEVAVIEGAEATCEIMAPLDGEIVEVNEALADAPEELTDDPTGAGWLLRVEPSDPGQVEEYMDEAAYVRFTR